MEDKHEAEKLHAREREARNGLFIAVCLLLLSGYVVVSAWFLPRPEGWQTAPAMLPLLLGASLFVMAGFIAHDTIKQGALRALFDFRRGDEHGRDDRPLWRIVVAMVTVGVFYFVLLRYLPFEIAAFVFLLVMMQVFWREGSFGARLALAVVVPFIITGAFQGVFGIPLPGQSNLVQDFLYWVQH